MFDDPFDRENQTERLGWQKKKSHSDQEKEKLPPVEIAPSYLSDEAFVGLIDSFILREGTDYGAVETSHEKKFSQIRNQIFRGEVKIVFDPNTESVTLLSLLEWKALQK